MKPKYSRRIVESAHQHRPYSFWRRSFVFKLLVVGSCVHWHKRRAMLSHERKGHMKILMVLTSHDQLGNTGRKTGFWLEEFAAPYYTFLDAGATVTLASPRGGQPPLDPVSDTPEGQTDWTRRFKQDPAAQAVLASTSRLADVQAGDPDAVFYPGGQGPQWALAVV